MLENDVNLSDVTKNQLSIMKLNFKKVNYLIEILVCSAIKLILNKNHNPISYKYD